MLKKILHGIGRTLSILLKIYIILFVIYSVANITNTIELSLQKQEEIAEMQRNILITLQENKKELAVKDFEKPTYEYLKSVTVKIEGMSLKCALKDEEILCNEEAWFGTGVIVKVKNNYTYI